MQYFSEAATDAADPGLLTSTAHYTEILIAPPINQHCTLHWNN
jgi:hypothetical protein